MKSKELRKALTGALTKATKGQLPVDDGKNIIGLANQITSNMAVEVKVMTMKNSLGHAEQTFGHLNVDE